MKNQPCWKKYQIRIRRIDSLKLRWEFFLADFIIRRVIHDQSVILKTFRTMVKIKFYWRNLNFVFHSCQLSVINILNLKILLIGIFNRFLITWIRIMSRSHLVWCLCDDHFLFNAAVAHYDKMIDFNLVDYFTFVFFLEVCFESLAVIVDF